MPHQSYSPSLPGIDLDSIRDRKRLHYPWPTQGIEFVVEKIHRSIRYHLGDIFPCDPRGALELCGYQVEDDECLGEYIGEFGRSKIAGIIDGENRIVRLSRSFSSNVRNFTASHELGHAVLHPPMTQHRDRPIDGGGNSVRRSKKEEEADEFASLFLMPKERVLAEFQRKFEIVPFVLNENTAFALYGANLWDVRNRWRSARDGARELARATHFDRYHFQSLSQRFGVSIEAMAIRIERLGLVALR